MNVEALQLFHWFWWFPIEFWKCSTLNSIRLQKDVQRQFFAQEGQRSRWRMSLHAICKQKSVYLSAVNWVPGWLSKGNIQSCDRIAVAMTMIRQYLIMLTHLLPSLYWCQILCYCKKVTHIQAAMQTDVTQACNKLFTDRWSHVCKWNSPNTWAKAARTLTLLRLNIPFRAGMHNWGVRVPSLKVILPHWAAFIMNVCTTHWGSQGAYFWKSEKFLQV